jgi:hypothetical protein
MTGSTLSRRLWIQAFRRILPTVGSLVAMGSIIGCIALGPSEEQGGSGSEIVGKAVYPGSGTLCKIGGSEATSALPLPVVLGSVFCYTRSFIPDTSWASAGVLPRAYTDSLGTFHLLDVPRGKVVVEAADGNGMGKTQTITIDRDSTVFDIGTLTVARTGGVSIQAHTQLAGRVRFYMSVMGTRCIVRGSAANIDIVLDNIPVGIPHTINIRVYEPIPLNLNIPDVVVPVGGTRILDAFEIK